MDERQAIVQRVLEGNNAIAFAVTKDLLAAGSLGDLSVLVAAASEQTALEKLVGRVSLLFPDYDEDAREVFEVPECREWMKAVQQEVPYLALLLHPEMTFKILMLCEIEWTKSPDKSQILYDEDRALGYMLDTGMTAFEFAMWQGLDPKPFAKRVLVSLGLGEIVNDDLLADYAATYAQERE